MGISKRIRSDGINIPIVRIEQLSGYAGREPF
jgi:hypothetical protein